MLFDVKKGVLAAVAMAAAGMATTAGAADVTAQFKVKIVIESSCSVVAGIGAADIDFGTVPSSDTNLQANNSGTIKVTCSNTTPYSIGLLPSNSDATGAGTMAGPGGPVPYQLRQAAGLTAAVWGNTVGTNRVVGTGNGAEQTYTAHATVPSANYTPGAYEDTVTVTVTY